MQIQIVLLKKQFQELKNILIKFASLQILYKLLSSILEINMIVDNDQTLFNVQKFENDINFALIDGCLEKFLISDIHSSNIFINNKLALQDVYPNIIRLISLTTDLDNSAIIILCIYYVKLSHINNITINNTIIYNITINKKIDFLLHLNRLEIILKKLDNDYNDNNSIIIIDDNLELYLETLLILWTTNNKNNNFSEINSDISFIKTLFDSSILKILILHTMTKIIQYDPNNIGRKISVITLPLLIESLLFNDENIKMESFVRLIIAMSLSLNETLTEKAKINPADMNSEDHSSSVSKKIQIFEF